MLNEIVMVVELFKDEEDLPLINNIYTFSRDNVKKAEQMFLFSIEKHGLKIKSEEERMSLLDDGYCELPEGGTILIWHDSYETTDNVNKELEEIKTVQQLEIDSVFANARVITDYAVGLFKLIIPTWDSIKIMGFNAVACNKATSSYIWEKVLSFDKNSGVDNPGMVWLNKGFAINNSLLDWEFFIDWSKIEMQELGTSNE